PAVERLRARAKEAGTTGPTVQEAIEAMVAPQVFHDAANSIRSKTRKDARVVGLLALALAALLAGGLRLAWRRPAPAATRTTVEPTPAPAADTDAKPDEAASA
ncbi:MAG TPA: hypothetical protein VN903_01640, partial [Polyangia bacterium]|nr:hypothetical protein [Polyangia bacterium]